MEGQGGAQERGGGPHEPSPRDREGTTEGPGEVCGLPQDHPVEGTDPDTNDLERHGTSLYARTYSI